MVECKIGGAVDDKFGPRTDVEHLKTLRFILMGARQLVYAIDEGDTSDRHFQSDVNRPQMHNDVRIMLECLDNAVGRCARLIDELDR